MIAIIAILAAILFPVFAKAREKARQTSCASNEKQLGLGFLQYQQDNDEETVVGGGPNSYQNGQGWAGQIYPYVKSTGVYTCPDDSTANSTNAITAYPNSNTHVSYGLNANLDPPAGAVTLAQFQSPAKTVVLFEVVGSQADPSTAYCTANPNNCTSPVHDGGSPTGNGSVTAANSALGYTDSSGAQYATGLFANIAPASPNTPAASYATLTGRHTDGSNYQFADGHVKWLRGSAVSAGNDNPTANDPGTVGPTVPAAQYTGNSNGNFTSNSILAANTGNSNYAATFSFD